MSEDRFRELLGPYVLGELTAEEESELEHHLEDAERSMLQALHLPPAG